VRTQDVAGLDWKNRMYPLHGDVKNLIFSFLFMRKEEGIPTLKYVSLLSPSSPSPL
jgi:hypothetical protein